ERADGAVPVAPEAAQLLAGCYRARGTIFQGLDQHEAARLALARSVELEEHLLAQSPEDRGRALELATDRNNLALALISLGQLDEAFRLCRSAADEWRTAVDQQPDWPAGRHSLAGILDTLGNIRSKQGGYADAVDLFRQAAAEEEKATALAPQVASYRDWL